MDSKPELPGRNDFTMAFKAIALSRDLSGDAKTVGAVIIMHFNAKTGQCDPGTDRLAARAGVSTRNVVKATNALHKSGLVVKTRHGGNGFRSSYQPNWDRFREIVAAAECPDGDDDIVHKRSLSKCTNVHLDSEQTFTLTHLRNSPKELKDGASGNAASPSRSSTSMAERVKGLMSESVRKAQCSSHIRSKVVARPTMAELAKDRALSQIDADLRALGSAAHADALGRMTPDIEEAASIAELKEPGAGLRVVIDRLRLGGGRGGVKSSGPLGPSTAWVSCAHNFSGRLSFEKPL